MLILACMFLSEEIKKREQEFSHICCGNNVDKLYAFGSSVTDKFNKQKSDIDLVAELNVADPIVRGAKLLSLWDDLEKFFSRDIDLLTSNSITNPVLKYNIDRTKILIYDRRGSKVYI
jgi:predicted nucleotidyltransferase